MIIGFDVDGTLINSGLAHFLAINCVLSKYNQSLIDIESLKKSYKDYQGFYQELGIRQGSFQEWNIFYQTAFQDWVTMLKPSLFLGTAEVLEILSLYLAECGRLILVTSQREEIIRLYDTYSGFLKFFKKDNIFEDNIFYVPHGDRKFLTLRQIKEKDLNHQDNIYIFISDTPDDLEDAQKAGWNVYGLATNCSFSTKENLERVIKRGSGAVLQSLLELKEMFLND